jgi:hypothetical protein
LHALAAIIGLLLCQPSQARFAGAPPQLGAFESKAASLQCDIIQPWYGALLSDLYTDLIRDGLLAKFDALYLFGTPDQCLDQINLVNPSLFQLTVNGSGLLWYEWQGYKGDGATAYLHMATSMASMAHYKQNDAHMSVWALISTPGVLEDDIGTAISTAITLAPSDVSGSQNAQLNTLTPVDSGVGTTGLFAIDRTSSSVLNVYTNGVANSADPISSTSSGVPAQTIDILRAQGTNFADNLLCYAAWGSHLSAADEAHLFADLNRACGAGSWARSPISDATNGRQVWNDASNALVAASGLKVWCLCPMPRASNSTSFLNYPATVFGPQDETPNARSTFTGGAGHAVAGMEIIANRCDQCGTGGSTLPTLIIPTIFDSGGHRVEMSFTTKALADTATEVMVAYTLNPTHSKCGGLCDLDIAEAGGMADSDVLSFATVAANPSAYCAVSESNCITTNQVVLSKTALAAVTKVPATELMLDDEVQDYHTGAEQIALATELRLIASANGDHLWYITNALNQAVAVENGRTSSSVDGFCAQFDYCGILVTDFSLSNRYTVT